MYTYPEVLLIPLAKRGILLDYLKCKGSTAIVQRYLVEMKRIYTVPAELVAHLLLQLYS